MNDYRPPWQLSCHALLIVGICTLLLAYVNTCCPRNAGSTFPMTCYPHTQLSPL